MSNETSALLPVNGTIALASLPAGSAAGDLFKYSGSAWTVGAPTFADNLFRIYDNSVTTKLLAFECTNITAATTRTFTIANGDSISSVVLNTSSLMMGNSTYSTWLAGATNNAVFGYLAGNAATTMNNSCAFGHNALNSATDPDNCLGIGSSALSNVTTGDDNIGVGRAAGATITTGNTNICIGNSADVNAAASVGRIVIGHNMTATANNSCFIKNIRGTTTAVADAIAVLIDSAGQLGTVSSSQRFKENIQTMTPSLVDKMLNLNPVTFNYKSDETKKNTYGLIAEEVYELIPDIVVKDAEGQIETVQYHLLVPMLIAVCKSLKNEIELLKSN